MSYTQANLYKLLDTINSSIECAPDKKTRLILIKADPRTKLGWKVEQRVDEQIRGMASVWMKTRDMYHYLMGLGHGFGIGKWAE